MTTFTCSNCGSPCDCLYSCPGCGGTLCVACAHDGNRMAVLLKTYRCAKCAEEDKMKNDGGAAFPDVCENCGCTSDDHAWISRKCKNGRTYEKLIPRKEYSEIQNAMLAEDAEHEKEG